MRDALSMLDQVVSFSGEKMTLEDALLVTGSIGQDVFFQLADALIEKDVAKALSCVEQLVEDGKDPVRLTEDFITFLPRFTRLTCCTRANRVIGNCNRRRYVS